MYELRMPHVGPLANMGLIICMEYRWIGLSPTNASRWKSEQDMKRDMKILMNDSQFKKTEFYNTLMYGISHKV